MTIWDFILGDGALEIAFVLVFIWIVTIASKSALLTASVPSVLLLITETSESALLTASVPLLITESGDFTAFTCVLLSFLIQVCFFCSVIPIAGLDLLNYRVISVVSLQNYLRK